MIPEAFGSLESQKTAETSNQSQDEKPITSENAGRECWLEK